MIKQLAWTTALVLAVAAGCAAPPAAPADTSADVAAINEMMDREIAAFAAGDVETIKAMFAADAILMPPGEPAITGLGGLEAWMKGFHEQFTVSAEFTSSDVIVSGNLAVYRYAAELTLTPKAGGDPVSDTSKGLVVLRRQTDGSWKIAQEVWNADEPASGVGAGN